MAVYSIKDLEKLTGIKAHTLRIWEQRYEVLCPKRTQTNIRYYTDEDLRSVLNISLLNRKGIKISHIAQMSKVEIAAKVADISDVSLESDAQLDALTISTMEMDEFKIEKILNAHISQIGFEKTMIEVVYPFLEKLSLLWLTGSFLPIHEYFVSVLIRRKIIAAIDREPLVSDNSRPKFLLYLPEGETQELTLFFVHYLLRARKFRVVYLGQNIILEDLAVVNEIHQPDYVFTLLSEAFQREPAHQYVQKLSKVFPQSTVLISGYQASVQHGNVMVLESFGDVMEFMEKMTQPARVSQQV